MSIEDMLLDTKTVNENIDELKKILRVAKELQDWDSVVEIQERIFELFPNNSIALNDLILAFEELEDLDRVYELQKKYLELNPEDRRVRGLLIKAAKERGDFPEVKRLQMENLEMDPENVKALSDLVKIARMEGDLETIEELQSKMFEIDPDDVKALIDLVNIAKGRGDWETVKTLQTRALEINPKDIKAMFDLLRIAKNEGDFQEVERLQKMINEALTEQKNEIDETRKRLYSGQIDQREVKDIIEKFRGSLMGVLLISEVCAFFDMDTQALHVLNGYKNSHKKMKDEDKECIIKAIKIVETKIENEPKIIPNSVYKPEER